VGFLSVITDVTERKRAEEALRLERNRAQEYLDIAGVILVGVNENGEISLMNRKGYEVLGYQEGELVGQNWFDTCLPSQIADEVKSVFQELMSGNIKPMEYYENSVLTASGEERCIAWHNAMLTDESGSIVGTLSSGEDITERKRAEDEKHKLEEKMQQVQKLKSLGVLAGGIAHDFNNLLMGVLGVADLASHEVPSTSPVHQHLEQIQKASRRATDLCRQMLAYSGQGQFVVKTFSLASLIEDMSQLIGVSASKNIVLKCDFAKNVPPIEADINQVRQVVMNLITNASEAVGEADGVVRVSTGVMQADRDYLSRTYLDDDLPEGSYVYLEVSDTGCGMDRETQAKIFDPFFSTKFTGRGLGLAALLGIVRGHRGAVTVESEVGQGTTIRVLFPASDRPQEVLDAEHQVVAPWKGEGTVLVVDDEEVAREVATLMFRDSGFSLLTAKDGHEGVEVFRQHADSIVAVVLDMTMPRMNGKVAFQELRRIRDDVKVILVSGYHEEDARRRFDTEGLSGFLQKPFVRAQLMEKLGEALHAA
jgi:two-component system cell cycle sensor histidine kinase/response regulator CckA